MQTSARQPEARAGRGQRARRREREHVKARQRRVVTFAGGAIVLVLAVLLAGRLLSQNSMPATPDAPAPPSLVEQVTSIPADTLEQVGRGTVSALPTPVRTDVQRGPSGLPQVTYVGAEYCPFCAGERWALIVALSRFGTLAGLQLSHSATDDVYPNTATFSFVGSTYSSQYVELSPVELENNLRSGSSYQPLQTPTPAQNSLLQTYDAPPYVPASSAGSIPFIDFAGQYIVSGASFDVGALRGMTQPQIAAALDDPTTPQAQAVLGSANVLTAAICSGTGNSPSQVCSLPAVASLETTLAAQPSPTGR